MVLSDHDHKEEKSTTINFKPRSHIVIIIPGVYYG